MLWDRPDVSTPGWYPPLDLVAPKPTRGLRWWLELLSRLVGPMEDSDDGKLLRPLNQLRAEDEAARSACLWCTRTCQVGVATGGFIARHRFDPYSGSGRVFFGGTNDHQAR